MAREAILVANSAVAQDIQKSVTVSVLRRTLARFEGILQSLEEGKKFRVSKFINATPQIIKTELENAARLSAHNNELLLFYYFGHGDLTADFSLQLVFPPDDNNEPQFLKLSALEGIIKDVELKKSLTLLDCCFAGAGERSFYSTLETDRHCRLACTTPTSRALITTAKNEAPIGAFTQAILDGFSAPQACISSIDNSVTAGSLFRYAKKITMGLTQNVQAPKILGQLDEVLFEYVSTPRIIPGYNTIAGGKTSYAKLFAICSTLDLREYWEKVEDLYKAILHDYLHTFLTPYLTDDGALTYKPAKPDVVRRYLRFLRSLKLLERKEISLTQLGKEVVRARDTHYNDLLITAIEEYLGARSLSLEKIKKVLRDILGFRGIPTKAEIFDRLVREGFRLPVAELGIIMDILGYAGALRMTKDRAYFPW